MSCQKSSPCACAKISGIATLQLARKWSFRLFICSHFLPFLDKILQRVRGEKRQLKSLWIFLDKLSLDRGISFFIAYFILPKGNSSVKIIFISADDDVSPLRRHIFRHRNLFICLFNTVIRYIFIIYFVVMPTKTFSSLVSTLS